MSKGSAREVTEDSPPIKRSRIDLRVGSASAPNVAFRVRENGQRAEIGHLGELVQIIGDPRLPKHGQHLRQLLFILDRAT